MDKTGKIGGSSPAVLLGFAEALSSPEVAWSLVDAGFRVLAFSRKGHKCALRHSRYVTIFSITPPEINASAAVEDLNSLLREIHSKDESSPGLLFPLDDTALWLCCESPLPQNWVLAGPNSAGERFALDKSLQIDAAITAGLKAPTTTIVKCAAEVSTDAIDFPVILKPASAVLRQGNRLRKGSNWICANRHELERALAEWREEYPLVMQPYIGGAGVGVFGFADARGVSCWSAHRRLRMMNPHGSGSSACVSRPVPQSLKFPIECLIKKNQWRGLFMVEFLQDETGQYWFIEFNGRPWGSMALSRRQGFEYPAWNANIALAPDSAIRHQEQFGTEIVCRNVGRELMHLLFVLRGRKSGAIRQWPSFWRSLTEVLSVRPRDRFYNFRRDDWKVFFSDCVCTIRDQLFKRRKGEQKA
jgi:predicted ATP-grasp superfamily ATP-dependent carboligase